jgi:cobalamin biosynthesis Mg chelatase CobN
MHRPRHPRSSARLSFSLLSVLALLAFSALPAFALADSGETVYETDIPKVPKQHKTTPKKSDGKKEEGKGGPQAQTSNETPSEPESSESPETGTPEESSEEEKAQVNPGTSGGDKNPPPNGGSNPGNGGNKAETGVGSSAPAETKTPVVNTQSEQPASKSSGGSSSPLVPILIAIAVLAAISIGAVLYKQRRSDSGSGGASVSPKAG